MTDAQIEELDNLAIDYKKWQRKRMAALDKEVEIKGDLLKAMKRHKRETYKYEDIEIEVVPGEESLKVKAAKVEEDKE